MPLLISYYLFLIFELLVAGGLCFFTLSLLYSSLKGSPFVPTKKKQLEQFLKEANLKKGQYFIELGCGDGRVVIEAVKHYHVKGLGVDVNPFLIVLSKIKAKFAKVKNIEFKVENIFDTNLRKADVVYLFLMPELIKKLTPKLQKELPKKSVVISHGFRVEDWKKKLFKTLSEKPFPTYYYRV